MAPRSKSERDFQLKADVRAILWAQGYSTRVDVLLAYDLDGARQGRAARVGLTDLDVLGVRLDPGFHVHTVVADCKTTAGRVPERLFWLSGVGRFFGSDANLLARSQPLPEHASALARTLGVTLAGPDDLAVLTNTFVHAESQLPPPLREQFFSSELLGDTLDRLSRLPEKLRPVSHYREARYWMDPPHVQLKRVVGALQQMAKDGSRGPTFQLVFADFVWLYVVSLWRACEALTANGLSRVERGLEVYINGGEPNLRSLNDLQHSFAALARRAGVEASLPILPPYFSELLELVVRCLRRPEATSRMARRAEWVIVAQLVGELGRPPWVPSDHDLIADKLLGDAARFLVRSSGLGNDLLDSYLELLRDTDLPAESPPLPASREPHARATDASDGATQSKLNLTESESAPELEPPAEAPRELEVAGRSQPSPDREGDPRSSETGESRPEDA